MIERAVRTLGIALVNLRKSLISTSLSRNLEIAYNTEKRETFRSM
jgi:hypothetical protein